MTKAAFPRFFFAILFLFACSSSHCYAKRVVDTVLVKTIQGGVKEVDAVKRTLVLETKIDDVVISVPIKAKIFRGAEEVAFLDIEKEDEATIKYYEDEFGVMQVLSIILLG